MQQDGRALGGAGVVLPTHTRTHTTHTHSVAVEDMEDMEDMVEAVEARTWLKKKKASLPNALIMHFSSGSFRSARPPALNAECWMMMNPSCAEC